MDLLPSQDAQFFKLPHSPLAQLVLDIVCQHDRANTFGDCRCGVHVRKGQRQRHINSVVHPAVNAYLAASNR